MLKTISNIISAISWLWLALLFVNIIADLGKMIRAKIKDSYETKKQKRLNYKMLRYMLNL